VPCRPRVCCWRGAGSPRHAAADVDSRLTIDDVDAWEREHGRIRPGSVVILFTGWLDRWDDPGEFLGLDENGGLPIEGGSGSPVRVLAFLPPRHPHRPR